MTAIALLLLLTAGAAGYVSWADYRIAHGDPAWWFVAFAPLAYLLPVLLLASVWFTLSWIWRTPRAPEYRLGPAACARLFLGEVSAVALSWPLMVAHRLLIADPVAAPSRLPLLLVHGVAVNDGVWFALRRNLWRRGLGPVYTINYGPPLAGIEHFAGQLASRIDAVCAATGAQRVALIAHSMGGLVSRYYLEVLEGWRDCRALITFGTPYRGAVNAVGFIANGYKQIGLDLTAVLRSCPAVRMIRPMPCGTSRLWTMPFRRLRSVAVVILRLMPPPRAVLGISTP